MDSIKFITVDDVTYRIVADNTISIQIGNNAYSSIDGTITLPDLISRIETLESYHQIVSVPTFANSSTTFSGERFLVTINVPNGTVVRYTTDETEPTSQSTQYSTPFYIYGTTTIAAKTFSGNSSSQTVYATYTKEATTEPVSSGNIYYMGTTEATESNYQSLLNYDNSNFPTSYTTNGREVLYFAIPTTKTLTVIDPSINGAVSQGNIATTNGYNIIRVPASRTIGGTVNISLT